MSTSDMLITAGSIGAAVAFVAMLLDRLAHRFLPKQSERITNVLMWFGFAGMLATFIGLLLGWTVWSVECASR